MTLYGKLLAFWETGSEGVYWSFEDEAKEGYDSLNILEEGDELTVFVGEDIVWYGLIKLEYKRNYRPYPMNPQYGQQEVCGYWVHGLQEDVVPEVWAKMFIHEYRAELIKTSLVTK